MHTTLDPRKQRNTRAFTVVELLISMALLALAFGVVLPTSFFLIKSNVALGNATVMTTQGRQLVEQLGADVRSTVSISKVAERSLEMTTEDPDGLQTKITYVYDLKTDTLTRKLGNGRARVILDDIVSLKFVYYNAQDTKTTKLIDTKKVEVQMTLRNSVMGKTQTYEQKSTRFVLRNRATPNSA